MIYLHESECFLYMSKYNLQRANVKIQFFDIVEDDILIGIITSQQPPAISPSFEASVTNEIGSKE